MNFNSRLLNEAKELEKLWKETKLLEVYERSGSELYRQS